MHWFRRLAVLALLPLLAHCASAPRLDGIPPSQAIAASDSSRLDRWVIGDLGPAPAESGVQLVERNALAFAYRAATAAVAERTLDLQYYIWKDDLTGKLLAAEVLRAAERGVRVRVLVDDLDARAKHDVMRIADEHPNVEVRIFNPFYSRYGSVMLYTEFALRGSRLFRRMHNKAWIADNRVAIIGGRNIGDEYFGAAQQSNFADLDVVLTGPVVSDVSRSFDAYWNSSHAIPVSRFDGRKPQPGDLDMLVHYAEDYSARAGQMPYVAALLDPAQRAKLIAAAPPPLRVRGIQLLVDDPEKVGQESSGSPTELSRVLGGLERTIWTARQELLVISPYLVPGEDGSRDLVDDVARGLKVRVLTNSLAATDVAAVHSGYARYRRELLRGGVELYEMKPQAQGEGEPRHISAIGSSNATLHTKAMVVDRRWAFVGSMNLDPRSAFLNTEMGVLVDSPELAEQLREQFEFNASPDLSFRAALEPHNELVWYDRHDGKERRSEHEPDASVGRRLSVTLMRLLPIESQL